jgi:hypothetical protein
LALFDAGLETIRLIRLETELMQSDAETTSSRVKLAVGDWHRQKALAFDE